jgi:glucuronosyltransferase
VDAIVNEFSLPLVDHLGILFIFFDPGPGMFWSLAAKGVSHDYASIPPLLGSYSSQMTFYERMTNFPVTDGFLVLQKFYLLAALDQLAKKDFPAARPISEMERNAELNFANIHPASSWTRLLPPTLIPVPAMHVRPCRYRRFPITKSIVIIFSRF